MDNTSHRGKSLHVGLMDWPIYFRENLIIGDLNSQVAICTLWKKKEIVKEKVKSFSIIGNLYSKDGINYILRNLLANPKIRYVLFVGPDLSGSGRSFLDLMEYGVDSEHRIKRNGFQLQKEIDIDAIEILRKHIRVENLVEKAEETNFDIEEAIRLLRNELPVYLTEPQIFKESRPTCEIYPSERNAFLVRGDFIAEVWVKLLNIIGLYGQREKTEYSLEQQELIDVVSVISSEDPDNIFFVDYFPFKKEDLEGSKKDKKSNLQLLLPFICPVGEFYKEGDSSKLSARGHRHRIRCDSRPEGYYSKLITAFPVGTPADTSYTYGQRLIQFNGINQIANIIEKLKAVRHSRRAVAVLWDPTKDSKSQNPPCLDLIQFRIINNRVTMTAYFRSHDIFRAWPENAFALRKLQGIVAKEVGGLELDDLIIVSSSAHIYENKWAEAKEIVTNFHPRFLETARKKRDPRGSFYIYLKDKSIVANHYSSEGKLLNTFAGKSTKELRQQISPFISQVSHALYLGEELQKVEIASKFNLTYVQDGDISLSSLRKE